VGWYLSWGLSGKESTFFRADKENSSQAAQDNQKESVLKEEDNRRESMSKL